MSIKVYNKRRAKSKQISRGFKIDQSLEKEKAKVAGYHSGTFATILN